MSILGEGFPVALAIDGIGTLYFEITEATLGAIRGGDKIPRTTHSNTKRRTFVPPTLYEVDDATVTARFDPAIYGMMKSNVNVNKKFTWTLPDDSTIEDYGWLMSLEFQGMTEAGEALADITIASSGLNGSGVETEPTWTTGS